MKRKCYHVFEDIEEKRERYSNGFFTQVVVYRCIKCGEIRYVRFKHI